MKVSWRAFGRAWEGTLTGQQRGNYTEVGLDGANQDWYTWGPPREQADGKGWVLTSLLQKEGAAQRNGLYGKYLVERSDQRPLKGDMAIVLELGDKNTHWPILMFAAVCMKASHEALVQGDKQKSAGLAMFSADLTELVIQQRIKDDLPELSVEKMQCLSSVHVGERIGDMDWTEVRDRALMAVAMAVDVTGCDSNSSGYGLSQVPLLKGLVAALEWMHGNVHLAQHMSQVHVRYLNDAHSRAMAKQFEHLTGIKGTAPCPPPSKDGAYWVWGTMSGLRGTECWQAVRVTMINDEVNIVTGGHHISVGFLPCDVVWGPEIPEPAPLPKRV
jgi:hypothetical protein